MARNPIGMPHVVALDCRGRRTLATKLVRRTLQEGVDEAWLQGLLHANPSLLPADLVDERVQEPLVPLGQEISTPSGYIDNLMISQNGYPVIVETKLWRNPEAKRKVVAQILDYAAQIRRWDYAQLQEVWRKHTGNASGLWEYVRPADYDSEADWVDLVSENLRLGRMTLLIVGDGIRSEARQLAQAVGNNPDFQFRLGLVELRTYDLDDGRVLVIPSCIARTVEVERAVVRIEQVGAGRQTVSVETPVASVDSQRRTSILDEQAFIDELRRASGDGDKAAASARKLLDLIRDTDLFLDWQKASVSLKYSDPGGSGTLFSLGFIFRNGTVGCWMSVLESQLQKAISDPKTAQRIADDHANRVRQLGAEGKKDLGLHLSAVYGREPEIVKWLETTMRAIRQEAAREGSEVE